MEVRVHEDMKLVEVWLTRQEQADDAIREQLQQMYQDYKARSSIPGVVTCMLSPVICWFLIASGLKNWRWYWRKVQILPLAIARHFRYNVDCIKRNKE